MNPTQREARLAGPDDLLTVGQAARLLDVSPTYLSRIARQGKVEFETSGPYGWRVFRRAEIERLLSERAAGTAAA